MRGKGEVRLRALGEVFATLVSGVTTGTSGRTFEQEQLPDPSMSSISGHRRYDVGHGNGEGDAPSDTER